MNKKILFLLVAVIAGVVIIGLQFSGKNNTASVIDSSKSNSDSNVQSVTAKEGQRIKLTSTPEGKYAPGEIKVKVGTKVTIEGDLKTLTGGMDTVIIDEYGIRKLIKPDDNAIEFVADKTGSFRIYCANGMGNGKLIVE